MVIKPSKPLELNSKLNPPKPSIDTPVRLSFQYARPGHRFCLCHHTGDEVRGVVDCLRQLTTMTWVQVLQTGGKAGKKGGLGYTTYKDGELKHVTRPRALSPDIQISAVRASKKSRVFGAYKDHIYYVVWFDRNHKIVAG